MATPFRTCRRSIWRPRACCSRGPAPSATCTCHPAAIPRSPCFAPSRPGPAERRRSTGRSRSAGMGTSPPTRIDRRPAWCSSHGPTLVGETAALGVSPRSSVSWKGSAGVREARRHSSSSARRRSRSPTQTASRRAGFGLSRSGPATASGSVSTCLRSVEAAWRSMAKSLGRSKRLSRRSSRRRTQWRRPCQRARGHSSWRATGSPSMIACGKRSAARARTERRSCASWAAFTVARYEGLDDEWEKL